MMASASVFLCSCTSYMVVLVAASASVLLGMALDWY
jgi:hypothetical protein